MKIKYAAFFVLMLCTFNVNVIAGGQNPFFEMVASAPIKEGQIRVIYTIDLPPSDEVVDYVSKCISNTFRILEFESIQYQWFQNDKIILSGGPRIRKTDNNYSVLSFPLLFGYMGNIYFLGEMYATGRITDLHFFRIKLSQEIQKGDLQK